MFRRSQGAVSVAPFGSIGLATGLSWLCYFRALQLGETFTPGSTMNLLVAKSSSNTSQFNYIAGLEFLLSSRHFVPVYFDFSFPSGRSDKISVFSMMDRRREMAIGKSLTTNNTSLPQGGTETLQIQIQHHFMEAHASLWLDNRLLYTHSLHGDTKTRTLMFRKVEGLHSAIIAVPAGKHTLRVRIQSVTVHYDQSKTIVGEFIGNTQKTLRIICDKKHGELKLSLQGRSE